MTKKTMKKPLSILYICAFFALCIIPVAFMFPGIQGPSSEKRDLAPPPVVYDENGVNYKLPGDISDYFSDHFGLRNYYVTGYAALNYYTLNSSSNEKVIAGKDGWLFFNETVRDYLGKDLMTPVQIAHIKKTLELQKEYLDSQNVAFIFTLAANKNSLYGEYMPPWYVKASPNSNRQLLAESLKGSDVIYADLYGALLAHKGEGQLYHKQDTHWNNFGALVGYRELLRNVQNEVKGFEFDPYENTKYEIKKEFSGDLAGMLLPSAELKDDQYVYDIGTNYKPDKPIRSPEAMDIITRSKVNDHRLLIFRDSFANALIPYVSNAFGVVEYSRVFPYDFRLMQKEKPDVVIEQIVERNLPNLLTKAPILPAPLRTLPDTGAEDNAIQAKAMSEDAGSYIKIFGWAHSESAGTDREIYVQLVQGSKSYTFEPFPILDSDIREQAMKETGLAGISDEGFSMMVDKKALPPGEYTIQLVIRDGEKVSRTAPLGSITIQP